MIHVSRLRSKDQTGSAMHRLIRMYGSDVDRITTPQGRPLSATDLPSAYDFVRKIPYRRDVKPIEVIVRPAKIARYSAEGMDCKKKAILLASYLRRRGIPYRLVATSRRTDRRIHHVFPQINIAGQWFNLDATYPDSKPLEPKQLTAFEVLK